MNKNVEILIVEENSAESEHLKRILELHDYDVTVEPNGKRALDEIRRRQPHVVIITAALSKTDGYELCRAVKADEKLKDVPVILLTSLSDKTNIIRGMECGADSFVTKPVDEKLFVSVIENILLKRVPNKEAGAQNGTSSDEVKHPIASERDPVVELLISTYETAVQKNLELQQVRGELNGLNQQFEERVKGRTGEITKELIEYKTAEAALKEQQKFLRQMIDANPNIIFIKDEDGRFIEANQAMARIYGISVEDLIGKTAADFVRQEEANRIADEDREVLSSLQSKFIPEERVANLKTGETHWLQTIKKPLISSNGQIRQILCVATDITERKRGEEKLRDSERYFRALIESASDVITVLDGDGIVRYESPSIQRIFGYIPDELIGKKIFELIHPDDLLAIENIFISGLQNPGVTQFIECRFRHKDNSWRVVEATGINLLDDPAISGIIVNSRDITNRKEAEKALYESELMLRQAQKMEAIGRLTGGVAHDFNNLLTAILGNTQLALSKLPTDDPLRNRLVEIEKASNRAAILTSQLLAFSRRQHLERRHINLNDNIAEIIKLLQRIIGEDVEMSVKCAPNLWAVFADPAQIEQVVMNLVVNARDAMPQGGKLSIETRNVELDESNYRPYPYIMRGKYVQISISDTGVGMDAETKSHIFEPYFTTKGLGKGTGLGLSMVYGIVKQHGGYINVQSEVGEGTTFEVFLPIAEKTNDEKTQPVQLPLLGGMETILVAEDEESLRKVAKDILEGLDYKVLVAKNGEEALEIYEKNQDQIDLLLFDIIMPRMGGVEASERIREMGGRMPLIFMTGYNFETIQSRFVNQRQLIENLGAIVIQKPYNVQTLGRRVREVLDGVKKDGKSKS